MDGHNKALEAQLNDLKQIDGIKNRQIEELRSKGENLQADLA